MRSGAAKSPRSYLLSRRGGEVLLYHLPTGVQVMVPRSNYAAPYVQSASSRPVSCHSVDELCWWISRTEPVQRLFEFPTQCTAQDTIISMYIVDAMCAVEN